MAEVYTVNRLLMCTQAVFDILNSGCIQELARDITKLLRADCFLIMH